ncbi:hypothetical protein D021_1895B, partial [Vibrio parahaemolyticus 10296]
FFLSDLSLEARRSLDAKYLGWE